MRWQSPERGLIPPMEFISYAEESGLIVPLGRWVMLDVVRRSKMARQGDQHARRGQRLRPSAGGPDHLQ